MTDDATSPDSIWLSASAILAEVKHRAGGAMKVPTLNKFARELRQLPDIHSRSTSANKATPSSRFPKIYCKMHQFSKIYCKAYSCISIHYNPLQ